MSEIETYLAKNPPIRETVIGYSVRDKEVLLGVRTRVSNNLGHLIVAGIGGGIEDGESPDEALEREIFEEVRVRVTNYQRVGRIVCLSPHHPSWNLSVVIYMVTGFTGEPQKTEDIDPYWYQQDELPLHEMWLDNRITARMVLDGKRIAGTFLYGADGQIVEQELRVLAADELTAGLADPDSTAIL